MNASHTPSVGWVRGFGAVFRGMRFVYLEHPSLVRLWIFPILITVACLVFGLGRLGDLAAAIVDGFWTAPDSAEGALAVAEDAARTALLFVLRAVFMLLGVVVLFALSSVIASPFSDALSEAVERIHAGNEAPPFRLRTLLRDLGRTLFIEAGKLLLYLGVIGPLFLVGLFVPAVGAVVGPLAFVLTALYLAIDYIDWPLARRNRPAGARLRLVRERFGALFGFGTGAWLCLYVPCLNLFLMPAAVAGGTLLFLELEALEAAEGKSTTPS
ncbi:MAG: EI24 domain-containing protein [Myxococcota bacterium]